MTTRVKEIYSKSTKDDIILLALGPCATILAYELSNDNRQALDLGRVGMYYRRLKNNVPIKK